MNLPKKVFESCPSILAHLQQDLLIKAYSAQYFSTILTLAFFVNLYSKSVSTSDVINLFVPSRLTGFEN